MTVLDRALVAGDAGRVTGDQERPDPEVLERARRRTFTLAYKQEILPLRHYSQGRGTDGPLRATPTWEQVLGWLGARRTHLELPTTTSCVPSPHS